MAALQVSWHMEKPMGRGQFPWANGVGKTGAILHEAEKNILGLSEALTLKGNWELSCWFRMLVLDYGLSAPWSVCPAMLRPKEHRQPHLCDCGSVNRPGGLLFRKDTGPSQTDPCVLLPCAVETGPQALSKPLPVSASAWSSLESSGETLLELASHLGSITDPAGLLTPEVPIQQGCRGGRSPHRQVPSSDGSGAQAREQLWLIV